MCHAVLAVVSNCCPPLKGRFLTRYSPVRHCPLLHLDSAIASYISGAFISEEAGASKPSAAYFDYVFSHIDGITRDNCLLVGDSLSSDIRGANNAGIPCCWYNPKKAARPGDLRIDYEIRDLRQLYDLV